MTLLVWSSAYSTWGKVKFILNSSNFVFPAVYGNGIELLRTRSRSGARIGQVGSRAPDEIP